MGNSTFVHVSLFEDASVEAQLRSLVKFVMDDMPLLGSDLDKFEDRLTRYARKAGVSEKQAKQTVRKKCEREFRTKLSSFGLA